MKVTDLFTPIYEQQIRLFHGTSQKVLDAILSGNQRAVVPVYQESNVSLGGTYLTIKPAIAEISAQRAARAHNSTPVVITVKPIFHLYPDEDWVVEAVEHPHKEDFDYSHEEWKDERYRGFFYELFAEYPGEGHSLSDTYKDLYDDLNYEYGITWEDSLRYIGSVRQREPLDKRQIVSFSRLLKS